MKIFWSWQSDTEGKTNRHLIRQALEGAIAELKGNADDLEEAERGLHLDHDRKGVPGSPDLVATILAKIRQSAVFIADVTPVGVTPAGKALLNANVAIELGYALGTVGDHGILMVLNEVYGGRETLPFDLRHKAGPILFRLEAGAPAAEIKAVQQRLKGDFKVALREFIAARPSPAPPPPAPHEEIPSTFNRAVYFQPDAILAANNGYPDRRGYRYPDAPSLYVRVIPRDAQDPLGNAEVKDLIGQHRLAPLFYRSGYSWALNRHGAIVFEAQSDTAEIFGATQVFRNREIWGIERTLLQPWDDPQKGRMKTIPGKTYEEVLGHGIRHYLRFAREGLAISGPLIIEAGATGVEGYAMGMGRRYIFSEWGPIHQTDILWRGVLEDDGELAADAALLAIFDTFFDAAGERRPPHWNNFPPQSPS